MTIRFYIVAIELIIDIFLFVDIFSKYSTPFIDPTSRLLVVDHVAIATRYRKSWLLIDVLSAFPFNVVLYFLSQYESYNTTSVQLLTLFIILRLIHVFYFFNHTVIENSSVSTYRWVLDLLILATEVLLVAHTIACLWFYISDENTWKKNVSGLSENSLYDNYVASLYFVIVSTLTVGYGDISGVTVWERLYIIAFLMGGLLYGGILARLVGILSSIGPRHKDIERRKQEITAYLNKRKVLPRELKYAAKVQCCVRIHGVCVCDRRVLGLYVVV